MNEASKIINYYICCASKDEHIAYIRPFIQECGKYACEKCLNELNEFYCYSCRQIHVTAPKILTPPSVIGILNQYRDEFDKLLNNKAKYEELIENLNAQHLQHEFNFDLESIKIEIELRFESLKTKLNEFKNELLGKIETIKERVKNVLSTDNIQYFKEKYDHTNSLIGSYSDYEDLIKQIQNDLNELKNELPSISFVKSTTELEINNIIGNLKIKENDIEILDNEYFSGYKSIPLTDNRLADISSIYPYNSIKIHNFKDGKIIDKLTGHKDGVCCLLMISNDRLASGSWDKTIKIWDLNIYKSIITLNKHEGIIICLKLLSNNKLASGSDDKTINIWNLNNYSCIQTINANSGNVSCLLYTINNQLVSTHDAYIKIWNLEDSLNINLKATLRGHSGEIQCLTLLSNDLFASGSNDNSIKIWNLSKYDCLKTLEEHKDSVNLIMSLPNKNFASSSWDKTIKIWNLKDFSCLTTIKRYCDGIYSLMYLTNNKLVSLGGDMYGKKIREYRIWSLNNYFCEKKVEIESEDTKKLLVTYV
jgi:WD40 repeat protein